MTLMSTRHSTSFTAYITFNSTVILTKLRKWGEYSTVPIFEMQIRKKKYILAIGDIVTSRDILLKIKC